MEHSAYLYSEGTMRIRHAVGLMALVVPATVLSAQQSGGSSSDMSVGIRAGTLGIGLEVSKLLSDNWGIRVGANSFSMTQSQTQSDMAVDATLKLQAITGLIDWYPAASGTFHLTAGVATNPMTVDGVGKPSGNGTISINDVQYTPAQVGTVNVSIKYPSAMPYVGLGWGTPASKDGGLSALFDIGAAIGQPSAVLSATGNAANLQSNLAAQQEKMKTDAGKVPVWPVISIGVVWRW